MFPVKTSLCKLQDTSYDGLSANDKETNRIQIRMHVPAYFQMFTVNNIYL